MNPKQPSSKHVATAFLPLATAFESLAQRLWYFVERLLRTRRRRAPSHGVSATPFPSGVTKLDFELRTHTTMGPPDFDRLLESFYRDPGLPKPRVFFCGPAPLGRSVAKSCHRLGLGFRSERF